MFYIALWGMNVSEKKNVGVGSEQISDKFDLSLISSAFTNIGEHDEAYPKIKV